MSEVLTGTSKEPDILWIFSHFAPKPEKPNDPKDEGYLTLAQNPHFYDKLPAACVDKFETRPAKGYQGTIRDLTNNQRRVFLDSDVKRRTFDNVWKTNNTLIFRGSCPAVISFP